MNKSRREALHSASSYIEKALDIVNDARYDEQDCIDNTPENLQSSERCEAMESAVDNLEEAADSLKEALHYIEKAVE